MKKSIKVGSDFSGVGAFNQALIRLGIDYDEVFACEMDKYARQTFIHNYGGPNYFPEDVYERKIPDESLDVFMTSPPCQSFSLAGNRKGEDDERGILFYNSHEFIQKNKPRFFIFENVKGLLSDANGRTFGKWIEYLGGKSVNGLPLIFPHEKSVPYHIYWKVLNAKDYGVPQNRERVFIVGIRDDEDNVFSFPKEEFLTKRLKDVLEDEVDEKYYLSDNTIQSFLLENEKQEAAGNKFKFEPIDKTELYSKAITTKAGNRKTDTFLKVNCIGNVNPSRQGMNGNIFDDNGLSPTLTTNKGEGLKIASQDIIIHGNLTGGKWDKQFEQSRRVFNPEGLCPTVHTMKGGGQVLKIIQKSRGKNKGGKHEISPTITTNSWQENNHLINNYRIRKLTPRECFRLMDFPDTFDFSVVSDSQAYKQAGNSIVVAVLAGIINNLKRL